jgi:hypothetical protein
VKLYESLSDDDLIDLVMGRNRLSSAPRVGNTYNDEDLKQPVSRAATTRDLPMVRGKPPKDCSADLFTESSSNSERYRPLDSVWYGEEDAELLEQLLRFYPHHEPQLILDATINGGRFWRNSNRRVIGLDIDVRHRPDVCAAIPFKSSVFDVVVYDPPHIPNQGRDRS